MVVTGKVLNTSSATKIMKENFSLSINILKVDFGAHVKGLTKLGESC